ncbi:NAD(P)-binding protein [Gonapodya prolifera JEL478]|uniref:NAD(P)-binding protein n=1 Tax=Gonapodya prolifera (strain JEL478) TaxID=1344416 RepID=A0A139A209_GONPJ|nr:NAD(P)-binding protein [Gonapodya prolifera JEL478]|eukprot:KXS10774.1 NAD(P)-binding protein [Gonapodya prolifera JEL478]
MPAEKSVPTGTESYADEKFLSADLFDISGKVALITGGATGIGKIFAQALVCNGARVYITSRNKARIDDVVEEVNRVYGGVNGGQCIGLAQRLGTKAQCDALARELRRREKEVHILIHAAAQRWSGHMHTAPELESFDGIFSLNVKSVYYLTVAMESLLERGSRGVDDPARVITIGSVEGVAGRGQDAKGNVAPGFWASQAAVLQMTRNLALMLAKRFITVNCMAPGAITATESTIAKQPTGKVASPEDIAGTILFMVSRASAHFLGTVIPVDGGSGLGKVDLLPSDVAIKRLDEEEAAERARAAAKL